MDCQIILNRSQIRLMSVTCSLPPASDFLATSKLINILIWIDCLGKPYLISSSDTFNSLHNLSFDLNSQVARGLLNTPSAQTLINARRHERHRAHSFLRIICHHRRPSMQALIHPTPVSSQTQIKVLSQLSEASPSPSSSARPTASASSSPSRSTRTTTATATLIRGLLARLVLWFRRIVDEEAVKRE